MELGRFLRSGLRYFILAARHRRACRPIRPLRGLTSFVSLEYSSEISSSSALVPLDLDLALLMGCCTGGRGGLIGGGPAGSGGGAECTPLL
jgi:hypothetical protein